MGKSESKINYTELPLPNKFTNIQNQANQLSNQLTGYKARKS